MFRDFIRLFDMRLIAVSIFLLFCFSVKSQDFYRTPSGKRYHEETCHTIQNSKKIKVVQDDIINFYLEPCKICKPALTDQTADEKKIGNPYPAAGPSKRCRGKTKKGEQCKLNTKDLSGYCHHHKGQA